jgi:predicted acyl esterase
MQMRDGVQLHTDVDLPNGNNTAHNLTFVLDRSPYGEVGARTLVPVDIPRRWLAQ